MSIRKQKLGLTSYAIACVLVMGCHGVYAAETGSDENSLANRLKEFNATGTKKIESTKKLKKVTVKKKQTLKSKAKKRVAKRKRYRRACYQSSAATLRDRAESFQPSIRNSSRRYGVSEALIISVITAESCFARHAKSPKNARGLMQLIPATAKRFGVKNAYVPSQNIKGGTRYLKFLLKRFSGNLHLAVAAYNAGEGAVDRYSGIPPYRETKEYVRRVMSVYKRLQEPGSRAIQVRRATQPNTIRASYSSGKSKKIHNIARSSSGRGHFIKPDYKWKRKSTSSSRVSGLYRVSNNRMRAACRDVSSQKLRRNSRLVKRGNTMKRYYSPRQPKSFSSIAKETGVNLNLLLRMNRNASRYMVKPGSKVLVWQCANR